MKIHSIENLKNILEKYEFDEIYCSNIYEQEICNNFDYHINPEIFVDGFNVENYGYIIIKNNKVDIYSKNIDFILLKHSKLKLERKFKLNAIYNSRN